MSLIYRKRANAPSLTHWVYDYYGEIAPFARRIDRRLALLPLVLLKSVEWGIYRWYKTPIRRFYGVKGNELIYMITRRCSDRCAKCGIWKTPEPDGEHLPIEQFLNCLNRLHENLYQVTLTGGEPLVYARDVLRIAEESKKLGVPAFVVTNGTILTERFLRRYAELGHTLVISLDTLDAERWAAFRGRDHFERVMGNLRLARSILGARLRIQSVLAMESRDDVVRIADFCRNHAIAHTVQPYLDFGGTWHNAEEYRDNGLPCAARKNICIYPNGDVVKCFDHHRIPAAREPLGNIAREDIITILCRRRATEVSRIMKTCNFPCKQMSCNLPVVIERAQA
jgi:MoaA/NifB/PqqE/SkfB family radical SAM enzyme